MKQKTEYTLYELYLMNVPTVEWFEYEDISQLTSGKIYTIKVLKSIESFRVIEEKTIVDLESAVQYLTSVESRYDEDQTIIIEPMYPFTKYGSVLLKDDGYIEISGDPTEEEKLEIDSIISIIKESWISEGCIIMIWTVSKGKVIISKVLKE